jgi:hypothetical protein
LVFDGTILAFHFQSGKCSFIGLLPEEKGKGNAGPRQQVALNALRKADDDRDSA